MARDTPCARSDRGSRYDTSRAKPCRYTCTETLLPANTWIFATSHAHAVSPRSLRYHNYYTTGNATCHRQSTAPSVNDLFPSFNLTTSSPPSTRPLASISPPQLPHRLPARPARLLWRFFTPRPVDRPPRRSRVRRFLPFSRPARPFSTRTPTPAPTALDPLVRFAVP